MMGWWSHEQRTDAQQRGGRTPLPPSSSELQVAASDNRERAQGRCMLTCLSIARHSHGVRLAQCNASTATNCSPPSPAGARENSKHVSSGQDDVQMPCCQAQCHSEHLCRHGCHCRRHAHARAKDHRVEFGWILPWVWDINMLPSK